MRPLRVILLILGIVLALIAFAMLAGGGALMWVQTTQRDADGYYTTSAERLSSSGYALTSGALDLGMHPGDWLPSDLATLRVRSQGSSGLFIGIARTSDVDRYLAGVDHTVVTDIRTDPFRATTHDVGGSKSPGAPEREDFWAATSRDGEVTWSVATGSWTIVVMNSDASKGVDASLSVGVKTALLLPIGIALLVVGVLLAIGAIAMIVGAFRGRRRDRDASRLPPGATPARPDDPTASATPARPDGSTIGSPSAPLTPPPP